MNVELFTLLSFVLFSITLVSSKCGHDLLPGINKMRYSIDVTELDLLNKEDPMNGFKKTVIDFTCHSGRTFVNTINKQTYSVPDQIKNVFMVPTGRLNRTITIYNSILDVQKALAVEAGIGVTEPLYGSFSASASYKDGEQIFQNATNFLSSADVVESVYFAQNERYLGHLFNEEMNLDLDMLPDNYTSDPKLYHEFIELYGTHYFSGAHFGGRMRLEVVTSSKLRETMDNDEIGANVDATFQEFLNVKAGVKYENKKISKAFSESSHITSSFFGGTVNLMDTDINWSMWWNSVASTPWFIKGHLAPLSDLLSIKNPKKNGMQLAVKGYIIYKSLPFYSKRLEDFISNNLYGLEQAHYLNNALNRLITSHDRLINYPLEAAHLIKEIEDYINPPKEWFDTKFCYGCLEQYDCLLDNNHFCSHVNQFKTAPRVSLSVFDKCELSIAYFPTGAFPWFENVRICLYTQTVTKYKPTTVLNHTNCAAPTKYTTTTAYAKQINICHFQQVRFNYDPDQVPGWFLNSEICSGDDVDEFLFCATVEELRLGMKENEFHHVFLKVAMKTKSF